MKSIHRSLGILFRMCLAVACILGGSASGAFAAREGQSLIRNAETAGVWADLTVVSTVVSPSGSKVYGLLRNDSTQTVIPLDVKVEYLDGLGNVLSVAPVPVDEMQAVIRPGELAQWGATNRGTVAGGSLRVVARGLQTIAQGGPRVVAPLVSTTVVGDTTEYRFTATNDTGVYAALRMWRGYSLDAQGRLLATFIIYRDEWDMEPKAPGHTNGLVYRVGGTSIKPSSIIVVGEYLREPVFTVGFSNERPSADETVTLGGSVLDALGRPIPGACVDYEGAAPGQPWGHVQTDAAGAFAVPMPAPPTGNYDSWIGFDDVAGVLDSADKVCAITRLPALRVRGAVAGWSNTDVTLAFADPWVAETSTPTVLPSWTVRYQFLPGLDGSSTTSPILYTGSPITVSVEGSRTLEYWAQDQHAEGNHRSLAVRIDKTAPVTKTTVKKTYKKRATITLKPTDTLSGTASTLYRLDRGGWKRGTSVKITTRGKHSLSFYSVDNAGNVELKRKVSFSVVK